MKGFTHREWRTAVAILRAVASNKAQSTTFTTIDNSVFYGFGDISLVSMLIDKMVTEGLLVETKFSHYSITPRGRELIEGEHDRWLT